MRISFIVLFISMMVFVTYQTSYKVKEMKDELHISQRQLADEKEELQTLKAEWMYLNSTERLASLSGKYLNTTPVQPVQLANLYEHRKYAQASLETK